MSVETHYFGDGHDHGPALPFPDDVEEAAGLLQAIGEAARQMALLTSYVNALRDRQATFAQLRPYLYEALALGQRILWQASDGWAPAVLARTRVGVTLAPDEVATAHDALLTHAAALEPMALIRPSVARELLETNALAARLEQGRA